MMKAFHSTVGAVLALGWLAAGFGPAEAQEAKAPAAASRKVFNDSVTPLPAQPGPAAHGLVMNVVGPLHKTETMDLLFSLEIPKEAQAKLEARVAKGEIIPREELQRDFAPKAADYDALVKWLKAEGYEITRTTPGRTSVYARASVAKIEESLQVPMVRFFKDGVTYNAAQKAPSLPADVGASVRAIIGLQPFRQMRKNARRARPITGGRAANKVLASAAAAPRPSPAIANAPPYLVSEVLGAYRADNLGVTGKGQKIAILIDRFPDDSDLKEFWSRNNLPVTLAQIEKVNVKGVTLPPPEGEETLDVEWTSGIAPRATIRIYATGSLEFVDLDLALDQIIADLANEPQLHQLSISLGLGETFMGAPGGEVATEHQKFLLLAASGVNVFVSSGDAGSNPDNTGHSTTGPLQAEYQASDPFVVAVGGTTLNLSGGGGVASELGWPGSGGGASIFWDRPVWQTGRGVGNGNKRLVPDVSLVADPNTGAFIFLQGQAQQFGGTSWSTPTWAGFCALLNEARANAGKPPLPFLNPLLYPLSGTSAFRDITSGTNGAFSAGTGYDEVTGIGVPNVKELSDALTQ